MVEQSTERINIAKRMAAYHVATRLNIL